MSSGWPYFFAYEAHEGALNLSVNFLRTWPKVHAFRLRFSVARIPCFQVIPTLGMSTNFYLLLFSFLHPSVHELSMRCYWSVASSVINTQEALAYNALTAYVGGSSKTGWVNCCATHWVPKGFVAMRSNGGGAHTPMQAHHSLQTLIFLAIWE